ncbi:MAG: translation initiation factor IF-2 [Candidatus Pacebacteria bacterium]|nr:translation initiation factor IF-2 [Candidatus Paceibacterota bacterium]
MKKEAKNVRKRAPVIVVMGHVDHGKSALLDYIRKTNVVAGEAGGITQHISAYEVAHTDQEGELRMITFLDTPGHESFSKMRSRGSKVADIAILVVSAEEGAKTQTMEAFEAIKKSGVPCIVAINKIDKPEANVERTKANLLEAGIYLEGMGGDIPFVPISAKSGEGVDDLLDMMLLVADLADLSGNPDTLATGVVIEAYRDTQKGILATLLIKDGALQKGMFVRAGGSVAPVRILEDFTGKSITAAQFSSPVRIIGFDSVPSAGELFATYTNKKDAERDALAHREEVSQADVMAPITAEGDETLTIPVILRADVLGSIEAIEHEIAKIQHDRVHIRVIQKNVGSISEGDIKTAQGDPNTLVIGFNVSADPAARDLATRSAIEVYTFDIIYKLAEWLEEEVKQRAPKIDVEELTGRATLLKVFSKTKDKQVVGGRAEEGVLKVGNTVQIIRRDNRVGTGKITNLQQQKAETKEVAAGTEFGAQIESRVELAPHDRIESFVIVKK